MQGRPVRTSRTVQKNHGRAVAAPLEAQPLAANIKRFLVHFFVHHMNRRLIFLK
jgi:hypothetical protein